MALSTLLRICVLCLMCGSEHSASGYPCKTPPFDTRRCYQMYTSSRLSWNESSAACGATRQRLASLENEKLLKFVNDSVGFLGYTWIGLYRTSSGQPLMWTNGQQLAGKLDPKVFFDASMDTGLTCSTFNGWNVVMNMNCSYTYYWICETYKSNIFRLSPVGHVVNDVSIGQPMASKVISIIECVRNCKSDLFCDAISHVGVTCKLHFQQTGHNITVTSSEVTYVRMS